MEYWDIYDINKQPTGRQMERNDFNMKPGDYHLTVLGVIRHEDGRFLITQRSDKKAWAAGWWEVPGGGVKAGESSEDAVLREIFEETGLDLKDASGGYLFTYRRDNPGEGDNYFVDIYRFETNAKETDLIFHKDEAKAIRFASLDEIETLAKAGRFLHFESIKQAFESGA